MMEPWEISGLATSVARVVREYGTKIDQQLRSWVKDELKTLADYIDESIEAIPQPKQGERGESIVGPPGPPGKDVDPEFVRSFIAVEVTKAVAAIPPPKDGAPGPAGENAPPVDTAVIVKEVLTQIPTREYVDAEVQKAISAIPLPKNGVDGKNADYELIRTMITEEVMRTVSALPPPKDGQDGVPGQNAPPVDTGALVKEVLMSTREYVAEEVTRAVSALPTPKDGRDGLPGKPGSSIVIGEGPPLSAGKPGDIYLDSKTGEIYREEEAHVATSGKH